MKRILFALALTVVSFTASAQIPYYAEANGKKSVYGYFEFGFRPGQNANEIDTYWQYGATDWLDAGFEYSSADDCAEFAPSLKAGYEFSQWFSISGVLRPWFSVDNNFRFSGMSGMAILQGSITRNGRLFWLTNTDIGFIDEYDGYTDQIWDIGYEFELKNGDCLTPMVGINHDWSLKEDIQPTVGLSYSHNWLGAYLWGGDLLGSFPRIGLALDIRF